MSDDLVKRAEQMMLEMQQLGYEVWPSIIRDLLADRRETALAMPEIARLVDELKWYGEQARLARLIHAEGDKGRHALARDGGKRSMAAIAALTQPE